MFKHHHVSMYHAGLLHAGRENRIHPGFLNSKSNPRSLQSGVMGPECQSPSTETERHRSDRSDLSLNLTTERIRLKSAKGKPCGAYGPEKGSEPLSTSSCVHATLKEKRLKITKARQRVKKHCRQLESTSQRTEFLSESAWETA